MKIIGLLTACVMVGCVSADDAGSLAGGGSASSADAAAGSGGASSTATSSSAGGAGGDMDETGAGVGGDGGPIVLSIGSAEGCAGSLRKVAAAPHESGAIALGRFDAPSLPFEVNEFRYIACDNSAHEVVYFSGGETPDDNPPLVSVGEVEHPTDETTVMFDSPVALSHEKPYLYVGIRMIADDTTTTCVVACRPGEHGSSNYWSSAPDAPYGWHSLWDDGLEYDYLFSVVGQPL